jgi:hypothetical protein
MRVEEGVDFACAIRQRGDGFQDGVGTGGGSAIDEEDAVTAGLRDYGCFAGKADDIEIVGEFLGGLLCEGKAKSGCCEDACRGLKQLTTCWMHFSVILYQLQTGLKGGPGWELRNHAPLHVAVDWGLELPAQDQMRMQSACPQLVR